MSQGLSSCQAPLRARKRFEEHGSRYLLGIQIQIKVSTYLAKPGLNNPFRLLLGKISYAFTDESHPRQCSGVLLPDGQAIQKAAQIEENAGPRPDLDLDAVPADSLRTSGDTCVSMSWEQVQVLDYGLYGPICARTLPYLPTAVLVALRGTCR